MPITYLEKHNPSQFRILGISSRANRGDVKRLHDDDHYNGYTRGKVKTRIDSNMPILPVNQGGTKCTRKDSPDLYQLYWRIFIQRVCEPKKTNEQ